MEALVATALGCVRVDLDDGEAVLVEDDPPPATRRVLAAARRRRRTRSGSRIAAVVDRRPPLLLSDDAGLTWREAGGGLPAGAAIAIDEAEPDRLLYASDIASLRLGGRRPLLARPADRADRDHRGRVLVVLSRTNRGRSIVMSSSDDLSRE